MHARIVFFYKEIFLRIIKGTNLAESAKVCQNFTDFVRIWKYIQYI